MGIKLLVKKDRDKNEYRHYLQEFTGNDIFITDPNLCEEHTSYLVEFVNKSGKTITSITYVTGTTNMVFGRAGRIE